MQISVTAFIFCLGFAVLLGYFFAWVYNYRKLHNEPKGIPQKITETVDVPIPISADTQQSATAIRRMEQEKTCYETDHAHKDIFMKKLLSLFRSRLEKGKGRIFSICYWTFNGEGFALRLYNSACRITENLFIPKNDRYFSRKEFNWNGMGDIPVEVFESEEQLINSVAGAAVSGDGKLRGYITIDSSDKGAFDEEICMELRELATLAEEVFRTLDLNFRLNSENNLLHGMLEDFSDIFGSSSKGNLIANLSKDLQENFRFHRLMIITPEEGEKWIISEAVGEQKEKFKGVVFKVHEKCLLYELLAGKAPHVNETKISKDPYQRRLYENEPENLSLRSLFAVMPPRRNNSYPLAIVLESRNDRAVSKMEEVILSSIVSCAALKISDFQGKDGSLQKKEEDFVGVDTNGLGEFLNYYKTEFADLKNGKNEDCLGIFFMRCVAASEEKKIAGFEKFLAVLKQIKTAWNGQHLAMLGNGEFVFSVKTDLKEDAFGLIARKIVANTENLFAEKSLSIKSHYIWLDKNKMEELEQKTGNSYMTLFTISVMNKFKEMSEIEANV